MYRGKIMRENVGVEEESANSQKVHRKLGAAGKIKSIITQENFSDLNSFMFDRSES